MASEYPRLNQLPEWFTIDPKRSYTLKTDHGEQFLFTGQELNNGIVWQLTASHEQFLQLSKNQ